MDAGGSGVHGLLHQVGQQRDVHQGQCFLGQHRAGGEHARPHPPATMSASLTGAMRCEVAGQPFKHRPEHSMWPSIVGRFGPSPESFLWLRPSLTWCLPARGGTRPWAPGSSASVVWAASMSRGSGARFPRQASCPPLTSGRIRGHVAQGGRCRYGLPSPVLRGRARCSGRVDARTCRLGPLLVGLLVLLNGLYVGAVVGPLSEEE